MNSLGFNLAALIFSIPWLLLWTNGQVSEGNKKLGIGGAVIRNDGTPPPFGSAIELDCGEGFKKVTEASPSGSFYFQIETSSQSADFFVDAERAFTREVSPSRAANSGQFPARHSLQTPSARNYRCQIRARLSGYYSSTATVTVDETNKIVDIGAIVLHPKAKNKKLDVNVDSLPKTDKKTSKKDIPKNEVK
jgi:hypothetical protein